MEKSKEQLEKEIGVLKKCMYGELVSGTNDYTILGNFFEALKRLTIELKKVDDIRYNNHKKSNISAEEFDDAVMENPRMWDEL